MMSGRGETLLLDDHGPAPDGVRVRVYSRSLEKAFEIERALLRRALTSAQIGRYRLRGHADARLLFYPYSPEDGRVVRVDEFLSAGVHPGAREFVAGLEGTLRGVRGNRTGRAWYGPGGTRVNAPWHARRVGEGYAPDIIVWRRFSRIAQAVIVPAEQYVPVGAMFAFSIEQAYAGAAERLLAFFNSTLANWYALMTTAKFGEGGWADRGMGTFEDLRFTEEFFAADLAPVRQPLALLRGGAGPASPAQILRAEREVDDWVYRAFGFDPALRDRIRWEQTAFVGNAALESAEERSSAALAIDTARG